MQKDFYLAAPFFNPEQVKVQQRIEMLCLKNNRTFFSPRLECLCPPHADLAQRERAFRLNIEHIESCKAILARIDDFDPGTIWELGYAFAKSTPAFAFTVVPNRGLNLMLAQSGLRLLCGWENIEAFIAGDFKVAEFWKEEIV